MRNCVRFWLVLSLVCISACSLSPESSDSAVVSVDADVQQAEKIYADGNLELAEGMMNAVLKKDPEHPQALYRLGTISFKKGDVERAAVLFEKSLKSDPRNAKAQFNLATIRLQQAEEHFKFYVATADPKTDISRISTLLGAIEEYAVEQK